MDNVYWKPIVEEFNLDELENDFHGFDRDIKRTIKISPSNKSHNEDKEKEIEIEKEKENYVEISFNPNQKDALIVKEEDFYDNNYWKINPSVFNTAEFDDLDLV